MARVRFLAVTICAWAKFVVGSFSAPRGFSPGTPVFPSPQKPALLNSNSLRNARTFKHEGALYKEVFPGKIEAHLSVTVKVGGSNSKWRAI